MVRGRRKEELQRAARDKPASLQSVVWRMARQPLRASVLLHGTHVALQFAGPLMLNRILQLLASIQTCDDATAEKVLGQGDELSGKCVRDAIWQGYLFCGILFVSKLVEALAVCHLT